MKNKNNKIIWFVIVIIIVLAGIFYFALSRQLSNNSVVNKINLTDNTQNNQSSNNTVNNSTNNTNAKPNQTQTPIKDETKISINSDQEKQIKQIIDQFYQNLWQKKLDSVFNLFSAEVRQSNSEKDIQEHIDQIPNSYQVLSIEIKSDDTAMVEILESENVKINKFIEFVPGSNKYLIARYFTSGDESTYAGFSINNP